MIVCCLYALDLLFIWEKEMVGWILVCRHRFYAKGCGGGQSLVFGISEL